MAKSDEKRLIELEAKRKKLDAEIREAKARAKKKARAQDTRRKILLGALVLDEMDRDEGFANWVRGKLPHYLTRDVDRELFDLKKIEGESGSSGDSET